MKSYQELIAERKRALSSGATTPPDSAPNKAMSVQEIIAKRRKELEDAAKASAAPAPASAASVPDALQPEQARGRNRRGPSFETQKQELEKKLAQEEQGGFFDEMVRAGSDYLVDPLIQGVGYAIDLDDRLRGALGATRLDPTGVGGAVVAREMSDDLRATIDAEYPKSAGMQRQDLELQQSGGFGGDMEAYIRSPWQTAKRGLSAVVGGAPLVRGLGAVAGSGVMTGGGAAKSEVDRLLQENPDATPQEIAERSRRALELGSAAGAVGVGLTNKLGLNPADEWLMGKSLGAMAPATVVAREALIGEPLEENLANIATNYAAQLSGDKERGLFEGTGKATAGAIAIGATAAMPAAVAQGVGVVREKLQNAGAYADESTAAQAAQKAAEEAKREAATTPPPSTQKAPIQPPKASGNVISEKAQTLAGKRISADMRNDPAIAAEAVTDPAALQERLRQYALEEQQKLDEPKLAKKIPSLIRGIAKAANAQSENPFDVSGSTNRILGNITKGIPIVTPVDQLVRAAQAQTRRPIAEPAAVPETPVAQPRQWIPEAPLPTREEARGIKKLQYRRDAYSAIDQAAAEKPTTITHAARPTSPVPTSTPLQNAGREIDARLAALREAANTNRLDEGTVKALQRDEEEMRLTLQEDQRRKDAGILQTPERPYLSDNARTLISNKRSEIREQLEKHRAAVGYGNQLRDLEADLNRLGDDDNAVLQLAEKLRTPTQPKLTGKSGIDITTPPPPKAPTDVAPVVSPNEQVISTSPSVPSDEVPDVKSNLNPAAGTAILPQETAPVNTQTTPVQEAVTPLAQATEPPVSTQETLSPPPATPVAPTATEAVVPTPTQPDVAPDANLDIATPNAKERFANKEDLLAELTSGFADKEATEARKVADNIVVYDGAADLQATDPEVAAIVEMAAKKQGATGARPRAFQFRGKVYFNMEGVKQGQAKSTFLHEARVHLAAESEPARISSLAGRVEALADLGDATAKEAVATVSGEYPGLTDAANKGNASAKDRAREEVLADFAQRVYERTKAGQGITGLAKRLYSDIMSYLRDVYTRGAKKLLGEKFALTIKDTDILDAVRYGRTAAGFKGESKPTKSAKERDKSAAFAMAPSDAANRAEGPLSAGKGISNRVSRASDKVLDTLRYYRGGSKATADMVIEMGGHINRSMWETLNAIKAVDAAGLKAMGKARWTSDAVQSDYVSFLSGDAAAGARLPKTVQAEVTKIRNTFDAGTLQILALGYVPAKDVAKYIANLGKWIHEAYKATEMPAGDWARINLESRGVNNQTLFQETFDSIKAEMVTDITLPNDQTLDKLLAKAKASPSSASASKLRRMFYNYGVPYIQGNLPNGQNGLESGVALLKRTRDEGFAKPEKLVEAAANLARRLIDPKNVDENKNQFNPYRTLAADASATMKRKSVPPWLKTLWGQNEEADAKIIASSAALASILAKHTMLAAHRQRLVDAGVLIEGGTAPYGYETLESDNPMDYGPLTGMHIRKEDRALIDLLKDQGAAEAMASLLGSTSTHVIWKGIEEAAAAAKVAAITLDLDAAIVNALSSATLIGYNSLLHPVRTGRNLTKALRGAQLEALNDIPLIPILGATPKAREAALEADIKMAMEAGYLGDAVLSQDMRADLKERLLDEAYKRAPRAVRLAAGGRRLWSNVKDTGSRINAAGDSFAKMLQWYNSIPTLAAAHPELDAAQVKALALEHAIKTMPSYSRAAPLARAISRHAIVFGSFFTFNAAMIQTSAAAVDIGKDYIWQGMKEGNAAKLSYGAQQMLGVAVRWGAIAASWKAAGWAITTMGAAIAMAIDDDEEEGLQYKAAGEKANDPVYMEGVRQFPLAYMRGDPIPVRQIDRDTMVVTSLARFDPGTFGAALAAYKREGTPESFAWEVIAPFLGAGIAAENVAGSIYGFSKAQAPGEVESKKGWDLLNKSVGRLVTSFVPGAIKDTFRANSDNLRDLADSLDEGQFKEIFSSLVRTPEPEARLTGYEKALSMMGATTRVVHWPTEIARQLGDVGQLASAASAEASYAISDGDVQGFWKEHAAAVEERISLVKDIRKIRDGANKLGYSDWEIEDMLEAQGQTIDKNLLQGAFENQVAIPDIYKSIENWYNRELPKVRENPTKVESLDKLRDKLINEADLRIEGYKKIITSRGMSVRD